MAKITLKILAEDIKTSRYINSHDCAITRAIQRATNNKNLLEAGGVIILDEISRVVCKTPEDLSRKVRGMYKHFYKNDSFTEDPIPPADFEFEMEIHDDFMN